jgi:hypothetical protein
MGAGWRKEATDLGRGKAKYFLRANWTTQIRLNRLKKLSFTRTSFSAGQVVSMLVRRSEIDLICPSGRSGDQRCGACLIRRLLCRSLSLEQF